MAYRIRVEPSVAAEVARFSDDTLQYWNASLAEIAADPFPRHGLFVERRIPIHGFPMRTFLYEISAETSISGEQIFVFVAEFFPEHIIVYVVNEADLEVLIIYLRESAY